jgi:hypothetical protein
MPIYLTGTATAVNTAGRCATLDDIAALDPCLIAYA